jgi:hypothetical protein
LEKQEKLKKAEQKEINVQIRAKKRERDRLNKAIAKIVAAEAKKKAVKKAKPSRIVILRVGSSILANIRS